MISLYDSAGRLKCSQARLLVAIQSQWRSLGGSERMPFSLSWRPHLSSSSEETVVVWREEKQDTPAMFPDRNGNGRSKHTKVHG